jgi:hypothetical protein
MSRSYNSYPLGAFVVVAVQLYFYFYTLEISEPAEQMLV